MNENLTSLEALHAATLIRTAHDAVQAALAATYEAYGEVSEETMRALNIAASQMHVARVHAPRA